MFCIECLVLFGGRGQQKKVPRKVTDHKRRLERDAELNYSASFQAPTMSHGFF